MRSKISPLAAAIAASTLAGSLALAQSEETPPPSSSTQGSMPQESSDYPGDSSTRDPAGAPGEATGSMGEGANAAAQIDQRKVEQFADAYVEVQTIQQKANEQLEGTTDPAQADQVKSTAQSDMIAAVERSGLKVEEFNQIVASMAADPDLRTRVSAEVQKRIGASGAPGAGT